MKWPLIVWIIYVTIFDGLRDSMMEMTNLIQINSGLSNMEIDTNEEYSFTYSIVQQREENKSTIWYDRAALYSLADKVRSDLRYKVLNHRTLLCRAVRSSELDVSLLLSFSCLGEIILLHIYILCTAIHNCSSSEFSFLRDT